MFLLSFSHYWIVFAVPNRISDEDLESHVIRHEHVWSIIVLKYEDIKGHIILNTIQFLLDFLRYGPVASAFEYASFQI